MLHFEKVNDDIYNEVIKIKCKTGQEGFMSTVKEIYLSVYKENTDAINLYESL